MLWCFVIIYNSQNCFAFYDWWFSVFNKKWLISIKSKSQAFCVFDKLHISFVRISFAILASYTVIDEVTISIAEVHSNWPPDFFLKLIKSRVRKKRIEYFNLKKNTVSVFKFVQYMHTFVGSIDVLACVNTDLDICQFRICKAKFKLIALIRAN